MKVEELSAYEVLEKREIKDIDSVVYRVKHKKTGAKFALISNNDDNKVFYIGFRTTPFDNTGVPHILEHSVLCGSKNFPLKDPFVELVKGSLNTFLNAMTYPDKTVYPVASCNDKDFQNLMHVYLDAVFYPNIYTNEAIFRQEGWHYELNEDGELIYNGVVYNEMKGVMSSPDSVLWSEIPSLLYPDTTYKVESGGDPECIPNLTYEQFLDFHRTYYHPSNSYIYLYGDMDMAEKLQYIDEEYLSQFDALEVASEVNTQEAFTVPVREEKAVSISEGDNALDSTYLAQCWAFGNTLDPELYIALSILDYALCSVPGAPVKTALTEKKIGKEVFSMYELSIKQPFFGFAAKGVAAEREEEFKSTVREVLEGIVRNGFDKKSLNAAITHFEFKYREADFGTTPKGLMYGLRLFDSWLYDEAKPFIHVEANETYASLRRKVDEGYFEELISNYILNNSHNVTLVLLPKEGLTAKNEAALKEKLAKIKADMSEEELQAVRDMMKKLEDFREMKDTPENIAKIPLLTREDLKREAPKYYNEMLTLDGTPVLHHDLFTNGIGYFRLIFKLKNIPKEYLPYLGILKMLYCNVDTANYSYGDLCNEINLVTGEIFAAQNNYGNANNPDEYQLTMEVCTKALYQNLPRAIELMEELIFTTKLEDTTRIKELLDENISKTREALSNHGHITAIDRALSYVSAASAMDEMLNGLDQFRFISNLADHYEEQKDELVEKLQTLVKMIYRPENLMLDLTGGVEALAPMEAPLAALKKKLYTCEVPAAKDTITIEKKNEGLTTAGQIDYVCNAGNFVKKGLPYTGALIVLRVMMGYEYLWTNIRVKGGAYGCMCNFNRDGNSYFCSYRDPNLGKTLEVYQNAAEFIANYDANERTMTQYIIGAISDLDTPLTAAGKGHRSRGAYMTGMTDEMVQTARNQVLDATAEDIRDLAKYIRAFMEDDCLCVVGNEQNITAEKDKFMKIEKLC